MTEVKTGRALQLEGLQFAQNKVTLGFKCEAGTKIALANEATQIGMTLSEYVDTVISTRHSLTNRGQGSDTSELWTKLENQKQQIQQLEGKVIFYENDLLKRAFHQYEGKSVTYVNHLGQNTQKSVNRIEDVYLILTDTVKLV